MRARIRSIKPEVLSDEELWDLGVETGLPIYQAFTGLWMYADREGRFEWRPRTLGPAILPFWKDDFSRVLDALETRGFIVRYAWQGRVYGWVRTFKLHQAINNKEPPSVLPDPNDKASKILSTSRVTHAPETRSGQAFVFPEGNGREGKGTEGNGSGSDASGTRAPAAESGPVSSEQVADVWNANVRAVTAGTNAHAHASRQWRTCFEAIAGAVNARATACGADAARVLDRLMDWFWSDSDGPVKSGRLDGAWVTPDKLADRAANDIRAAFGEKPRKVSGPSSREEHAADLAREGNPSWMEDA